MVTVKGFELPYSNKKVGKITLMEYQEEILEDDKKIIAVDAPTGSGKTLAMLKKAIDSTDKGGTALFLYPTNELLNDQIESFKQLLSLMGYNYSLFEAEEGIDESSEITIFPISGEHLDLMARGKAKGTLIRDRLNSPEIADSKLLILSNIDFIYNIIKDSYHQSELIYQDFYNNLQFVAVDELHLYNGTMFLSLLYSLKPIEKRINSLVLSTATHLKNLDVLIKSLSSEKSIIKAEEGNGRIVRYNTELELTCFGSDAYLSTDEHADSVLNKLENLLGKCANILCVFNSIIFAEKVSDLIEKRTGEEVGRIHGFVPKKVREEMRKKRIIVGTSSIEVGVDFDVEGLIFEANTAPSFIQRFGRVGRHRNGFAVAITPYYEYENLKKELNEQVHYKELEQKIRKIMEMPDDFSHIKETETGIRLYLAFIAALIALLKRTYGARKPEAIRTNEVKKKILDIALLDSLNPNFQKTLIEEEIEKIKKSERLSWAIKLIKLSTIFPRGGIPTVVAYFKKYNSFELTSITSLEKAKLTIRKSSDFSTKPIWLESLEEHEGDIPVFVIENIEFSNNLEIILSHNFPQNKLKTLNESDFTISSSWDEEVNDYIKNKLKGLPAFLTINKPNWRFTYLKAKHHGNKYLLIGGDAVIWNELQAQKFYI